MAAISFTLRHLTKSDRLELGPQFLTFTALLARPNRALRASVQTAPQELSLRQSCEAAARGI